MVFTKCKTKLEDESRHSMILGAMQLSNQDSDKKGNKLLEVMSVVDHRYNCPKCVYVDLNSDVNKIWA